MNDIVTRSAIRQLPELLEDFKKIAEKTQKTSETQYKTAKLLSIVAIVISFTSLIIGGIQIYPQAKTDYTDIITNQSQQIEQLKLLNTKSALLLEKQTNYKEKKFTNVKLSKR